jgi:hypothetical protein
VSNRFLITGLPRSRTSWFAVVTGADHETFSRSNTFPSGAIIWPSNLRGISDSGAAMTFRDGMAAMPVRTLIIERPKADVIESLRRYVHPHALDWKKVDALLDQALDQLRLDHPLIRRTSFYSLNSIDEVRACLSWLKVPEPPNLWMLMHMNIQSDLNWNMAMLRQRAA